MNRSACVIGPFGHGTSGADELPYGAEHLRSLGYDVWYADPEAAAVHRWKLSRLALRVVQWLMGGPRLEPVLSPRRLAAADVLVCFLEDNLTLLSPTLRLLRRGSRRSRTALVVVWLAQAVADMSDRELRRWRRRLLAFGHVIVFSSNQVDLLTAALDLPAGVVKFVPFGVKPLSIAGDEGEGSVLTVGNDVGRDFATFIEAFGDTDQASLILTNEHHRLRLVARGPVLVQGPVTRPEYLDRLRKCSVFVSVTEDLAYPGGQTSLIEAMQSGKACVVTRTDAIADYVRDGVDCILVPPKDTTSLRRAVAELMTDHARRTRIGSAAASSARGFSEASMWTAIVKVVST